MKRLPLVLALVLFAPQVRAEPEPDAAALALFKQGRALLAEGRWPEGCAKIAQSFERERHASALLNLARCDEHSGRLASAWSRTHEALPLVDRIADPVRRAELREAARASLASLEPRLPRLRVVSAEPVAGLHVEDEAGRVLPLDAALPFDPGPRLVRVSAPGRKAATYELSLASGQVATLAVALEREAPPPPAPAPAPALAPAPAPAPALAPELAPPCPPPPSRAWPLVTGLSAAALAGVAIGFGIDAAQASSAIRTRCGPDLVCDEDPSFDPGPLNARKNAGLGVAIGAGAGALVAGVVTWLLLDRGRRPTAAALLGPARF